LDLISLLSSIDQFSHFTIGTIKGVQQYLSKGNQHIQKGWKNVLSEYRQKEYNETPGPPPHCSDLQQ